MTLKITDVSLLRRLSALADHKRVTAQHLTEYAIEYYITSLCEACPNMTLAVPELAE
jgi:hypothetical protein